MNPRLPHTLCGVSQCIALVLVFLGPLGCEDPRWTLDQGGTQVTLLPDGQLRIMRGGRELLSSSSGETEQGSDRLRAGQAYAPLAVARTRQRDVEEVFGFFDFYDRVEPFVPLTVKQVSVDGGELRADLTPAGQLALHIDDDGSVDLQWRVPAQLGDRLAMSFSCQADERFFAMGAQVSAEHRGYRVPVWTQEQGVGKAIRGEAPTLFGVTGAHYDSYAPVPFALSSRPLGLWLDGTARSEWDFCEQGEVLRVQAEGGSLHLVVLAANSMVAAVERFTARSGRPRQVNRWTLAPWFDAFGGPEAVATAASTLRAQHIPASALWAEDWVGTLFALGGEHLTYDWREDPARYPDLAATARGLHAQALRFLVYVNPFVPRDADARPALASVNALVRDADGDVEELSFPFGELPALVDPTAPAAQAVFERFMDQAVDKGVDGWMADYGEALPYSSRLSDGRAGREAHNSYPLLWAGMSRQFWDRRRPDGDFAFFSRSGFTGSAAVHHVHWLGDQLTSFDRNDGLGSIVPLYLSAGLSGIALTHSDIGGYTSVGSSVRSRELMLRWLGLETFTPVFRTHHTSSPANNLQWFSDAAMLDQFRRHARWHQRLLPYFALVAEQAVQRGWPAVRPLWWGREKERELLGVDDAFMVGDALLVAPVVEEGQTRRSLRVPAGSWRRWRDLHAPLDAALPGGNVLELVAAPEETPVLVRAGAALPLLARDYDSMVTPRTGEVVDPALDVAPLPLDAMLLLLVAGGRDTGVLDHPELGELRWQWDGAALTGGSFTGVQVGAATIDTCTSSRQRSCVQDGSLRLGREELGGVEILLLQDGAAGQLRLWSATLRELFVVLR
ncbi:MAG: TIM-barrel domain-containing protein [Pseudomonadota bacterium]